jgi:tetratricopeptide (TPR) repeat protein
MFGVRRSHLPLMATAIAAITGCQPNPPPPTLPPEMVAGSQALTDHQPDAALADASAYLHQHPTGPAAAGAHYIQGRAYEMKISTDRAEQRMLLTSAHTAFELALHDLATAPDPNLEMDVHGELSNVAFFQDDFPTAIDQAQRAMTLDQTPKDQRHLLMCIGSSEQRLGRFEDAAMTFHQVEQRYPGTPEAAAAHDAAARRNFYVQLATYASAPPANTLVDQLSAPGGPLSGVGAVSSRVDMMGHTILDAGPFTTYPAAKQVREQVLAYFPDAVVVP